MKAKLESIRKTRQENKIKMEEMDCINFKNNLENCLKNLDIKKLELDGLVTFPFNINSEYFFVKDCINENVLKQKYGIKSIDPSYASKGENCCTYNADRMSLIVYRPNVLKDDEI